MKQARPIFDIGVDESAQRAMGATRPVNEDAETGRYLENVSRASRLVIMGRGHMANRTLIAFAATAALAFVATTALAAGPTGSRGPAGHAAGGRAPGGHAMGGPASVSHGGGRYAGGPRYGRGYGGYRGYRGYGGGGYGYGGYPAYGYGAYGYGGYLGCTADTTAMMRAPLSVP